MKLWFDLTLLGLGALGYMALMWNTGKPRPGARNLFRRTPPKLTRNQLRKLLQ